MLILRLNRTVIDVGRRLVTLSRRCRLILSASRSAHLGRIGEGLKLSVGASSRDFTHLEYPKYHY